MRSVNRILVVGIALVCVAIYLYTSAPFMLWLDAPRFVAAIVTLGIALPAEPVYVFLAHWFTYFPFGSVVFRIQVFSALLAGASLLLLYSLVVRVLKLPTQLPKKTHNSSHQRLDLSSQGMVILAGVCSMLVLAFSYEFWSQAQNVETFILDCFLELIVLILLLKNISHKTIFKILAIIVVICGIAIGTDPPVIASVFPLVLFVAWQWRKTLGIKRLAYLFLFGISGIVLAWSYLPIMELHHPRLNDANGLAVEGFLRITIGQGLNSYMPTIGAINGLTWVPEVILQDAWHYLEMVWTTFTPVLLPLIFAGGIYLWRYKRYVFTMFAFVVGTNFLLCSLYHSGNSEAWTLQSDVIFALLAGVGVYWLSALIVRRWPTLPFAVQAAVLLVVALIPLGYWWTTLDRHPWHLTQDYIDNLYRPLKEPALLIGDGDIWESVTEYVHAATDYKPKVVPIFIPFLISDDWTRQVIEQSHIRLPDTSHLPQAKPAEYIKFINDLIALNMPEYHVYITEYALHTRVFQSTKTPVPQFDPQRFTLVPAGMVEEIVPKNHAHAINLSDFDYRFGNGFPQTKPRILEQRDNDEMQGIIDTDIAFSYDSAATYLVNSGQPGKAATFYKKAYALSPKNVKILTDIGNFYGEQNDFANALSYLKKAYELAPDNPGVLYNLAITEGLLGEVDKERKYLESIIDNPQPDEAIEPMAAQKLSSLNNPAASSSADIPAPSLELTAPHGWNPFANTAMNIGFAYPPSLQLTQIDAQTVALSDVSHKKETEEMLIYSTTGTATDNLKLPLPVTGSLLDTLPVQLPGFTASMKVYASSVGVPEQLLFMQKNQQIFVIRFPANKAIDPSIVSDLVNSIIVLH